MKRIIAAILAAISLSFVIFSLASCDRSYDETEVLAAARPLIEESAELNEIFWGKGIRYDEGDLSSSIGAYYRADFFDLDRYNIRTIEDLKNKTRAVFTQRYCENIFSTVFSSIVDDEIQFYARYFQKYSDENNTVPEYIMVYSNAIALLKDNVVYLYDTMRVTGSKRESVYVSIDVVVTNSEGKSQTNTLNIGFIEEENGWRINTPTYNSYNPYKEAD